MVGYLQSHKFHIDSAITLTCAVEVTVRELDGRKPGRADPIVGWSFYKVHYHDHDYSAPKVQHHRVVVQNGT